MSTPTVTITDNLPGIVNHATTRVTYYFDFSEPVTGLSFDDFLILNCRVSAVSGSGANWQVTTTPNLGVDLSYMGLQLMAGSVKNAAGEVNAVATNIAQVIDNLAWAPKLLLDASYRHVVDPQITLQTRLGTVVIELDPQRAPATVANMLAYVNGDFYDGTLFHRVIKNFMVQGGGFTTGMVSRTPTYDPIVLESNNGLLNLRGTIAMARTDAANSATSQFFINHVDNGFLNYSSAASPGYAVFGKVVSGLSVIDSLAQLSVGTVAGYGDVPLSEEVITALNLTRVGSALTRTGVLAVSGLEAGGSWSYSVDKGQSWKAGSGSSLTLAEGSYGAGVIQVRQTDGLGNASVTPGVMVRALVVDTTAPLVQALSPADEALAVAPTRNIELVFSEAVEQGSGSIVLKTAAGVEVERFDVATSPRLALVGNTLTVNPTADLAQGTDYTLKLASGTLQDLAGNPLAGLGNYNFRTLVYPGEPASGQGKAIDVLAYSWNEHTLLHDVAVSSGGLALSTGSDGSVRLLDTSAAVVSIQASRPVPIDELEATDAAVNLQDAIAILKMVVGLNVNAGHPLSPYQALAADFDGNGAVELNDAIGVLKHVVGLTGVGTPKPGWQFVDEASAAVAAITADALHPGQPVAVAVDLSGSARVFKLGLVAYLRGDVDGCYAAATGAMDLDTERPDYLTDLSTAHSLNLSQFGVYG
jgi:cyclophilin family peptidyl-prolyl cis-trans isomerase/methionine-rich copper-binding protein CopC